MSSPYDKEYTEKRRSARTDPCCLWIWLGGAKPTKKLSTEKKIEGIAQVRHILHTTYGYTLNVSSMSIKSFLFLSK